MSVSGSMSIYDRKNKRFLGTAGNNSSTYSAVVQNSYATAAPFSMTGFSSTADLLKWEKITDKINSASAAKYGSTNVSACWFKDGSSVNLKLFLFTSALKWSPIALIDLSSCPNISNVTSDCIAFMRTNLGVFYGSGNTLYKVWYDYDFSTSTGANTSSYTSSVAYSGIPSGETITCVKLCQHPGFTYQYGDGTRKVDKILWVATWNETTKVGKVYQFAVNIVNGEISGLTNTYTIDGKVKDISLKFL